MRTAPRGLVRTGVAPLEVVAAIRCGNAPFADVDAVLGELGLPGALSSFVGANSPAFHVELRERLGEDGMGAPRFSKWSSVALKVGFMLPMPPAPCSGFTAKLGP